MKKGWKIFWIVCGVTAAVGLMCCIASLMMGVTTDMIEERFPNGIGWIKEDDSASDSVQRYSNIREIEGELFAGNIVVAVVDDSEITVETKGVSERLGFCSYEEDGTLYLKTKKNLKQWSNMNVGTITVSIPRDMIFEEVSLDIGAGKMDLESICANSFSIDAGAGEVNIQYFDARDAEINCGAGSVTACGRISEEMDMECGIGQISLTMDGCEDDYNYDISCGVGEIVCGGRSYSGIGHDDYVNNGAGKEMSLECGIGQINIAFRETEESHHGL
ncbi:MAG: DUF4097 family beta strand repeat-containing protein [Dorea sp.]